MITFFDQFGGTISCRFLSRDDDRTVSENSVRLHQVHGSKTIIACAPTDLSAVALAKADGVLTDTPKLDLIVRAADCQNFAIFVPEKNIIGVLHSGWKGLVAGAIPEFFRTLEHEFHVKSSDVFVAAGPSLCSSCAEFSDPISELPGIDQKHFSGRLVDLHSIADQQLLDAGVPATHLERHPDCTLCKNDVYLSYRGSDKEHVKAGLSNFLVCSLL
jgi:polyphenol oxidase